MSVETSHEKDFAAWAFEQARVLRAGRVDLLDREGVAEELDDMGRNEQRALRSHLVVLLAHLIKHAAQPERRGRSWTNTIDRTRIDIADVLRSSPSLRRILADEEFILGAWKRAAIDASEEMDRDWRALPGTCPWPIASVLEEGSFPDEFGPDNDPTL